MWRDKDSYSNYDLTTLFINSAGRDIIVNCTRCKSCESAAPWLRARAIMDQHVYIYRSNDCKRCAPNSLLIMQHVLHIRSFRVQNYYAAVGSNATKP